MNAADGSTIALTTDEQIFNGTQRKAMAFMMSRWINGDDVEVKPDRVLTATVGKDAVIGAARVTPSECVAASPAPVSGQ